MLWCVFPCFLTDFIVIIIATPPSTPAIIMRIDGSIYSLKKSLHTTPNVTIIEKITNNINERWYLDSSPKYFDTIKAIIPINGNITVAYCHLLFAKDKSAKSRNAIDTTTAIANNPMNKCCILPTLFSTIINN